MPSLTSTSLLITVLSVISAHTCAFQGVSPSAVFSSHCRVPSIHSSGVILHESSHSSDVQDGNSEARRSFLGKIAVIPVAALSTLASVPSIVQASGGATAGGAYLLSAKKRYYERVKEAVTGLLKAADALKDGDSKIAKEYFSSEDGGSWKDLTAAGYLLSNAFRRSSSTAPDSLPSVKVRKRKSPVFCKLNTIYMMRTIDSRHVLFALLLFAVL